MTDSEVFEQIGRKRAEYKERKIELAQLKAKSGDLAKHANTISLGLSSPESIRWFDGLPAIGRTQQHIFLTPAMFTELTEKNIKQLCEDIKKVEAVIFALRVDLTNLDDDPEL